MIQSLSSDYVVSQRKYPLPTISYNDQPTRLSVNYHLPISRFNRSLYLTILSHLYSELLIIPAKKHIEEGAILCYSLRASKMCEPNLVDSWITKLMKYEVSETEILTLVRYRFCLGAREARAQLEEWKQRYSEHKVRII